jgi:hypothetical protein
MRRDPGWRDGTPGTSCRAGRKPPQPIRGEAGFRGHGPREQAPRCVGPAGTVPWREPVTRWGEKNASGRQPGRAARPCFRAWRACRSANPWAASSTQCHPWQMPLTAAGGAYAHDIRAYRKEGVHAGPSTVGSPPAEDNQVGCVSLCSRVYSRAWQRNVPLRSLR